jgi:hypothetical protein
MSGLPLNNGNFNMNNRHEVLCVDKTDRYNPHERIEHIGGKNTDGSRWKITQERAIALIEGRECSFYVNRGGRTADVIVSKSKFGNKYIKTVADGDHPDNLLSLTNCSL